MSPVIAARGVCEGLYRCIESILQSLVQSRKPTDEIKAAPNCDLQAGMISLGRFRSQTQMCIEIIS